MITRIKNAIKAKGGSIKYYVKPYITLMVKLKKKDVVINIIHALVFLICRRL